MPLLVGRDPELGVLAEALAANDARAVLITGEPGSGKSSLLAEAERMAAGRCVLRVRGFQPEQAATLLAALPLLRTLAADEPRLASALEHISEGAVQLFEAAYLALSRLPGSALLVDDEQWLDPATSALVHFLVRSAHEEGLRLTAALSAQAPDFSPGLADPRASCDELSVAPDTVSSSAIAKPETPAEPAPSAEASHQPEDIGGSDVSVSPTVSRVNQPGPQAALRPGISGLQSGEDVNLAGR